MRIVAITDRRRMVAAELLASGDAVAIAEAFGAAVARAVAQLAPDEPIVQVREKDLDGAPLLQLVRAAMASGAKVMVNDRVDVALAAGAYGVHLPERGMTVELAHAVGPGLVIGVSCHSIDAVRRAGDAGADLVQLGPIWRTPGKAEPLGPLALQGARAVLRSETRLVAVGGVETRARLDDALRNGADAVAAIRGVWSGSLAPASTWRPTTHAPG
ncbi:MAG: thiamine phosphate synthase [Deltaproteobacteria bacterium]|nr:thiamine phosphate synthase [Deltaproteobacteria bacterium]